MNYTKNYNLHKPSYDDDVDIQVINNNTDVIDAELQHIVDRFKNYLPLIGGMMSGNINVPYNVGLNFDNNHFINFNTTAANGEVLPTLKLKSDRLKFYCPNGNEFVVDDSGISYGGNDILCGKYTNIDDFSGTLKLTNGLLLQWGFVNPENYDANHKTVTLPLPFYNGNYAVFTSKSNYTKNAPDTIGGEYYNISYKCTSTNFVIICDSKDTGEAVFWLAIGRGK